MKKKITYKELSLLLGIVVALLISITLWAGGSSDAGSVEAIKLPIPTIPPLAKTLIETAIDRLF